MKRLNSLKGVVTILDSPFLLRTKADFSELSQEILLFSPVPALLNYCIWEDGRISIPMMFMQKHTDENDIRPTKWSCIQSQLLMTKVPKRSASLCLPHWKWGERSLRTISCQEVLFSPPTLLLCSHILFVALLCLFQSEEALRAPPCSASLASFQFLLHRLWHPAAHLCTDWLTYFSLYEMVSSIPLSQP